MYSGITCLFCLFFSVILFIALHSHCLACFFYSFCFVVFFSFSGVSYNSLCVRAACNTPERILKPQKRKSRTSSMTWWLSTPFFATDSYTLFFFFAPWKKKTKKKLDEKRIRLSASVQSSSPLCRLNNKTKKKRKTYSDLMCILCQKKVLLRA